MGKCHEAKSDKMKVPTGSIRGNSQSEQDAYGCFFQSIECVW